MPATWKLRLATTQWAHTSASVSKVMDITPQKPAFVSRHISCPITSAIVPLENLDFFLAFHASNH